MQPVDPVPEFLGVSTEHNNPRQANRITTPKILCCSCHPCIHEDVVTSLINIQPALLAPEWSNLCSDIIQADQGPAGPIRGASPPSFDCQQRPQLNNVFHPDLSSILFDYLKVA